MTNAIKSENRVKCYISVQIWRKTEQLGRTTKAPKAHIQYNIYSGTARLDEYHCTETALLKISNDQASAPAVLYISTSFATIDHASLLESSRLPFALKDGLCNNFNISHLTKRQKRVWDTSSIPYALPFGVGCHFCIQMIPRFALP